MCFCVCIIQRNVSSAHRIKYPLGTIIRHTKYDFRGVVVGWDPRPTVDVSNWDGLQDVKGNVNEMPFYHVFPDRNDAVKAFGGPRPFRYVCEENLEICTGEDFGWGLLDVDLDPEEWVLERDLQSSSSLSLWKYTPSEDIRVSGGCVNLFIPYNSISLHVFCSFQLLGIIPKSDPFSLIVIHVSIFFH